jgi:hypothetical protein
MTLPSNARTGGSSLALLTAVACCTMGIEGRAQAPADAPPSKLTYSVKVGFLSPKLDYTRSVTPAGLHLYSGRIPYLFDPKTLTFILLSRPQSDFDPQIKIEGQAGVMEVGREWSVSFQEHPSAQARCNDLTQKTGKVKIVAQRSENVTVQGQPQPVEVVLAQVSGTWASCGYEGTYERTTHYAPSLGVFTVSNSTTRLSTGQVISNVQTRLENLQP